MKEDETCRHRKLEEKQRNGASHMDTQSVPSNWNNIHLFLVTGLLGASLILILECCLPPSAPWSLFGPNRVPLWDWTALQIVIAFTVLQGVLYHLPMGKVAEGKLGCDEKRLKYHMNGLHALVVTAALVLGLWFTGLFHGASITNRVLPIVSASTVVALLQSIALYVHSLHIHPSRLLRYDSNATLLVEFALGREVDPRLGRIDLKHFAMVRIGFIGWAMVDLSYLLTAVETQGSPSLCLLLVVIFQFIYILDFVLDEDSVLLTKEFTEEAIGFLMILGEYIWIPFFSSLPAFFLIQRPTHISTPSAVLICLLFAVGFAFYSLSNEQRLGFRKNPNDPAYACLETIPSPSGQRLLVSGWFGWVRHPNYLGDVLIALAWCLPCGFTSLLPYLPALQCFNLLRQRANEIEDSCQKKHGEAWLEYCCRVPYKLVPYVY
ncbi:delta(14)-sterol reductase TM7SF2 [Chanos chanos]|uniref:Delta(14)-sterol reductase TM7SF2 n=1 Tax=Chanos chanos TaxID=29144 RepID=A0A6J2VL14_CHACN|nr:delta(14)-sterol reductase TM7SF2-like [Chanos chanos]